MTQISHFDLKQCFKCGAEKPRLEFYAHPMMADGLLGKCKECAKADVSANRKQRQDQYSAYEKRRMRLPHRKQQGKAYSQSREAQQKKAYVIARYYASNPEKRAAHIVVGNAVRDGKLSKKPCQACGAEKVVAHHEDYSRPLDVIWLCSQCHANHHLHKRLIEQFHERRAS